MEVFENRHGYVVIDGERRTVLPQLGGFSGKRPTALVPITALVMRRESVPELLFCLYCNVPNHEVATCAHIEAVHEWVEHHHEGAT